VLLLLPFNLLFGQINFFKQYANNGYDYGQGIVQLEDSSYVICGSSSSFTNGPSQAFLLKVDSVGNYKWSNHYGGFESESARRVLYQENFGFFITGFTNSMGEGAYDYYMAKIDLNGQLEWEKTYGDFGWERVNDAALTRDTGAIMVGETDSNPTNNKDIYIVRTDINGDTLWTKTMGGSGDDWATCVERYQDSLFVIGGNIYNEDSLKSKAFILYMKDDGTIMDLDTMGNNGHYVLNDVTISHDTVQGVGTQYINESDGRNVVFYSKRLLSTNFASVGISIVPTSDGDRYGDLITNYRNESRRYCVFGRANDIYSFPYGTDIHVVRYNWALGFEGTISQIGADYPDIPGQMIPTSDGGMALVGYREGVGLGGATIFLMKYGPNETYPVIDDAIFIDNLVGIEEIAVIDQFKIYPNPTSTSITIEVKNFDLVQVNICNTFGQKIITEEFITSKSIDVRALAAGVYMVQTMRNGKIMGIHRLVVQ